MKRRTIIGICAIGILVVTVAWWLLKPESTGRPLRVAIAPYQDMAMLAAAKPQAIDRKRGIDLELVSMAWADLTPAVSSANASIDVAFASLIQFISQEARLNSNSSDPIVFFYPAYVFKGGAFVSFKPEVPVVTKDNVKDVDLIRKFLGYRFAVQKTSSYEMLLFDLAKRSGIRFANVSRVDMDAGDGLLAAVNGAVDVSAAGLTQRNEALQRKGRVVLDMQALGQVDIAGFIAKQSTITSRRPDLERMVRVWLASIDYVMADIEKNSAYSLEYLRKQSSTNYSIDAYKDALSQEVLPTSIAQVKSQIIAPDAEYNYRDVVRSVSAYYLDRGDIAKTPEHIEFIEIR